MNKAIITGANGFIGSTLVKKLVDNNVRVLAIDLSFTPSHLPESELVTKLETYIVSAEDLVNKIPQGEYDAFYHFAWAGVNGVVKADPIAQIKNIEMAAICMNACKQIRCKKFLCAGTIAEQSFLSLPNLTQTSGGMMYGVAKHCTHLILENYSKNIGQQFVWMQLSNIYGPGNRTGNIIGYTLGELLAGRNPSFGPAEQPYDFVSVDDTIEAIYRLGECETNHISYYIGSGCPRLLKDYLFAVGKTMNCPERIEIGKRPDDGIKYSYEMFNVTKIKADIGEYITKSFEEGIKETVEWQKNNQ
ncbi:MAG: NAD(P)-dependent oxidoreductase [Prevotella sp.]|nr:NAD(P)-dependent oxidoreductase [Prevotella sp.]